jgi:hypothetical protein
VASLVVIALALGGVWTWTRQPQTAVQPAGAVLETIRSGDLVVTVSSPEGQLRTGSNRFRVQFRSAATSEPIDVGTVQIAGSMAMPGMLMNSSIAITPTEQAGTYDATGDFGMAGSWRMRIEWNGPAGQGSAAFEGNVQ